MAAAEKNNQQVFLGLGHTYDSHLENNPEIMEELYRKYEKLGLKPYGAVPNYRQMEWYRREGTIFFHFGMKYINFYILCYNTEEYSKIIKWGNLGNQQ